MGTPADKPDNWEDSPGTAVAGPAYAETITQSDPDFETEAGTAVAGQDYVENIRKSAAVAAQPAPELTPAPAPPPAAPLAAKPFAPRSPTKAFGTPVMLRAPAAAAGDRRTPAPRLPGMTEAPAQPRSINSRKPAPSPHVDEPFEAAPAVEPRGAGRVAASEPVRDSAYNVPSLAHAQATPAAEVAANPVPSAPEYLDDGLEDSSAGDLDAFDSAETIAHLDPQPIPAPRAPTPAPLRPTPMRASSPPVDPQRLGSDDPLAATVPAGLHAAVTPMVPAPDPHRMASAPLVPAPPANSALPVTYPVVTGDPRQAYLAPLDSSVASVPKLEVAKPPRKRGIWIAAIAGIAVAAGVGAFILFGTSDTPPAAGAATSEPAAKSDEPVEMKAVTDGADTKAGEADDKAAAAEADASDKPDGAEKPDESTDKTAEQTAAETAEPAVKTTKTAATKTTKAPVRKKKTVAKKTVKKKRAVRRPVKKKKKTAKCSGLDCL